MKRYAFKVCGITRAQDANLLCSLGVGALGFIFYRKSPRFIEPEALTWLKDLPEDVLKVGVVVDHSVQEAQELYDSLGLDFLQLHGDQPLQYINDLKRPYWKVLRVKDSADLSSEVEPDAKAVLLDTKVDSEYGGSGRAFDWSVIGKKNWKQPTILAGGLNLENASKAFKIHGIDYWDFNSGLEESPGIKSASRIKKLIDLAEEAGLKPSSNWCRKE